MKKNDLIEIKKIDIKSLKDKIKKARSEVSDLYMDKNTGKLTNLRVLKNKRRDLAQLLTVLNQKVALQKLEEKDAKKE